MSTAERIWPAATYSYHTEFINGYEIEKPLPKLFHAIVQLFLGFWLLQSLRGEFRVLPELNVWCGADRLVPDLVVARRTAQYRDGDLVDPAALAIEILSQGQTLAELFRKSELLLACGAIRVWVIWPEKRQAWEYSHSGLTEIETFQVMDGNETSEMPASRLWAELD